MLPKVLLALLLLMATTSQSESFSHRALGDRRSDPEAHAMSSYDELWEVSAGLHRIEAANTNVFASLLVAPTLSRSVQYGDDLHTAARESQDLPRTHLGYNCTSASSVWNLHEDTNVLELESFGTASSGVGTSNNRVLPHRTDPNREVVATASLLVADCDELLRSSAGRVVLGNSLFGVPLAASPTYFYVLKSVGLDGAGSTSSWPTSTPPERCRVRLDMAYATFAEVYSNCRIKVHSTDIAHLIQTESREASVARRHLEESIFGFAKDASCKYECGEDGDVGEIGTDKCWAKEANTWTELQCTLQFYKQNKNCSTECGFEGEDVTLSPHQCYDCRSNDNSCDSGYSSTDTGCCRVLECVAVDDSTIESLETLSWNLEDDSLTIAEPSYPLFEIGNCSDTSPLTDCCRVECKNCFLNVSVASMFADVEFVGTSGFDEAIEIKLTGNANLEVALYAPNGCSFDETTQLKNASFNIPLGETGLTLEIAMNLELRKKLSLQSHGSTAVVGATAELQSLTAGSLRSETFYTVEISNNVSSELAQSGIDVTAELALVPSFQASISLLKGLARVGVKTEFLVFLELTSTFQSDPIPGLPSEYLDASSLWHFGDCRLPHFMEYNCSAGYGEVNISIPLSVDIPRIGTKTTELNLVSSSDRTGYSLFSGCIATAYDAEIVLSTVGNVVSSFSDDKRHALQTIIVWVLGMTDIDPSFVNITSVSIDTGEIFVLLSVPPSLGEMYRNASDFEAEVYRRARNASFSLVVSNYVGLNISAQCENNLWGVECDQLCIAEHCTNGDIRCNAVDGSTLSCGSCAKGYWGSTCGISCQGTDGCCNQTSGVAGECLSCGDDCGGSTSQSNSILLGESRAEFWLRIIFYGFGMLGLS